MKKEKDTISGKFDGDSAEKTITRRTLLTGAAAASVIGTMGALVGCSPAATDGSSSGAGDAHRGSSVSWRDVPAVPKAGDIAETKEVDVCVVGGGSSGLGAARSALLHGAQSVLVLEKNDVSRIGGGVHGILRSKIAREIGWDPSPELVDEMIKDEMRLSCMRADERYYRVWAERSEEVFDSMQEAFDTQHLHVINTGEAPYDQLKDEYFSEAVYPGQGLQVSESDVNTPIIEGFTKWVSENGGEIIYSCAGEQLIKDGDKIAGVYAKNSQGSYIQVNAKAVIISTGGFEGNNEMIEELAPHVIGTPIANTIPGEGDGIKMAVWAGGQTQISPCCIMLSSATSPENPNVPSPIPFVAVNKNGKRFANEATSSFLIPYAILNQPDRRAWQIFDKNYAKIINDLKIQTWMGTIIFDDAKCAKFESVATKEDTIEGLATAIGVDPDGLKKTLEKYSELTAKGHDDQFGVPPRFMKAVNPVEPPFYAMEIPYYIDVSVGGIICNPETSEVLDANREPIPGLFASGNTVGERFGACYTNNMTGLSNGFADVGGFIAGESAGAYISKL